MELWIHLGTQQNVISLISPPLSSASFHFLDLSSRTFFPRKCDPVSEPDGPGHRLHPGPHSPRFGYGRNQCVSFSDKKVKWSTFYPDLDRLFILCFFNWLWSPQFFSICWLRSIPKDLVNHVTFPNWVKPSRHRNPTAKEFFFLPIFLHRPHPRTNSGNKIRNLSVEPGYSEANGAENGARSAQHILHWRRCSTPS